MTRRRQLLGAALAAGLAPGCATFVRDAGEGDVPRFALGVASGAPRADGMVLWTRLTGPGLPPQVPVQWELADDAAFARIVARGTEQATADDAHSVHAEPAGLAPGRPWWFRFTAQGQRSAAGRTRSAPAPDAAVDRFAFAIASCQRWDTGHYVAWRHLAADAPDLVLFLGDYIYEYPSAPVALRLHDGGFVRTLAQYRARYALYKGDAALQAAHAAAPWLVIWDDHEVENDYAGLQGQHLQPDFPAQRAAAYQAWWEHMPVPKALRPVAGATRIHGRLDWGRLARLHVLDARQYRDPHACPPPGRGGGELVRADACPELADPRRSLLGAAQERWLADGWDLQRPWNLLAQTTLMARFDWDDPARGRPRRWTDGWDGYAASRQRLLGSVAERRVPGVVVLGGDVHAHYVADLKADFDDARAPVVASEFVTTSISSLGMEQQRLDTLLPFNPHLHHGRSDRRGYTRFTLERGQLQAQLMAVDDARDPASAVRTAARFAVEAGRPGAQRVDAP